MFQGNTFHLNMILIALFTSDVSFKQVSCVAVNFGFAVRCRTLETVVKYSASYRLPIIAVVLLHGPIFQLAIWPHNSPNFGYFRHTPLLSIRSIHHFERVWSDHD